MTEIELLRWFCWPAVITSTLAIVFPGYFLLRANGTFPLLVGIVVAAIANLGDALFLLFITYDLDQVNSTGAAEVGVFYLRIAPTIVGLVLLWMGRRLGSH